MNEYGILVKLCHVMKFRNKYNEINLIGLI